MARPNDINRRDWMKRLSLYAAATGLGLSGCGPANPRKGDGSPTPTPVPTGTPPGAKAPYFLVVLGATGGASIIDSFMAIRASESANASTINTFVDSEVASVPGT